MEFEEAITGMLQIDVALHGLAKQRRIEAGIPVKCDYAEISLEELRKHATNCGIDVWKKADTEDNVGSKPASSDARAPGSALAPAPDSALAEVPARNRTSQTSSYKD